MFFFGRKKLKQQLKELEDRNRKLREDIYKLLWGTEDERAEITLKYDLIFGTEHAIMNGIYNELNFPSGIQNTVGINTIKIKPK